VRYLPYPVVQIRLTLCSCGPNRCVWGAVTSASWPLYRCVLFFLYGVLHDTYLKLTIERRGLLLLCIMITYPMDIRRLTELSKSIVLA